MTGDVARPSPGRREMEMTEAATQNELMSPWSAIIRSRITNVLSYMAGRHCRYLEIAASDGTVLCIVVWFPHLFKGFQTSPIRHSIFNPKTAKCRKFRPLRKYLYLAACDISRHFK